MFLDKLVCFIFFLGLFQDGHSEKVDCKHPELVSHFVPLTEDGYYTEGCLRYTCKSGQWRASLEPNVCCFNSEAFDIGEVLVSEVQGCVETKLVCKAGDEGKAAAVLELTNKCGDLATAKQVTEIKDLLIEYHQQRQEDCMLHIGEASTTSSSTSTKEQSDCTLDNVDASTTSSSTSTKEQTGIIVSGGWGAQTDIEIFFPDTGRSCKLPDLPENRNGHTMNRVTLIAGIWDKLVICGGGADSTQSSCIYLSTESKTWKNYLKTTAYPRDGHTSWTIDGELFLLGGQESTHTLEVGSEEFGKFTQLSSRYACAIQPEGSDVMLTGGRDTMKKVRWIDNTHPYEPVITELPDMRDGRRYHACGHYIDEENHVVYLVAGGRGSYGSLIDTTEQFFFGHEDYAETWHFVDPLPRAMIAMKGVSLNNQVYVTGGGRGGRHDASSRRSEILAFNGTKWTNVGSMKTARNFHAAVAVDLNALPIQDLMNCD